MPEPPGVERQVRHRVRRCLERPMVAPTHRAKRARKLAVADARRRKRVRVVPSRRSVGGRRLLAAALPLPPLRNLPRGELADRTPHRVPRHVQPRHARRAAGRLVPQRRRAQRGLNAGQHRGAQRRPAGEEAAVQRDACGQLQPGLARKARQRRGARVVVEVSQHVLPVARAAEGEEDVAAPARNVRKVLLHLDGVDELHPHPRQPRPQRRVVHARAIHGVGEAGQLRARRGVREVEAGGQGGHHVAAAARLLPFLAAALLLAAALPRHSRPAASSDAGRSNCKQHGA
mmetsp:Transcript_41752/g.134973  ORF Transcript_41752/g.134973 Transcript_41752/m.134973 type:complete len:288 (-) Transcript_41752:133-996(-)